MKTLKTAWKVANVATDLLNRHPKLLLLPFFHILGYLLVIAVLLLPTLAGMPEWTWGAFFSELENWGDGDYRFFQMLAFYMGVIGSMTFMNAAFYHEILQAYNGSPVSLARGFRAAAARWRTLLVWAVPAGFIGGTLGTLQEVVGSFGRSVLTGLGMGWGLASLFVVPVMMREREFLGPVRLLRLSGRLLRGKWGEGVSGMVSFNLLAWFVLAASLLLGFWLMAGLGQLLFSTESEGLLVYRALGIPLVALACLLFALFITLLKHLYIAGLYIYASEGVIPEAFDESLMEEDWMVK